MLLKRYGTLGTEPPCSLVSVTHALERPGHAVMSRDLHRRRERLERVGSPHRANASSWLEKGDPIPEAEPGEELILLPGGKDDNDETLAERTGGTSRAMPDEQTPRRRRPARVMPSGLLPTCRGNSRS